MSVTFGPVIVVLVDPLAVGVETTAPPRQRSRLSGLRPGRRGGPRWLRRAAAYHARRRRPLGPLAEPRWASGGASRPIAGGWAARGWFAGGGVGRRIRRRVGAGDVLELVEMLPELLELGADGRIDRMAALVEPLVPIAPAVPVAGSGASSSAFSVASTFVRLVPVGAGRDHLVEVGDELLHRWRGLPASCPAAGNCVSSLSAFRAAVRCLRARSWFAPGVIVGVGGGAVCADPDVAIASAAATRVIVSRVRAWVKCRMRAWVVPPWVRSIPLHV